MITLNLTRGKDLEGIYIRLPAPQEKIEEAIARLDVISEDTATTRILNVSSSVKNLGDYIQNTDLSQPGSLQKVAALAEKLQPLDLESCLKFEGMLDANMVQGVDDVMKLADCLDEYVLLPEVGTGSALGRYLVNQGAFECPDHLRPYLDYQAIGQEFYGNHGGAFCRGGYAVQKTELPGTLQRRYEEITGVISLDLRTGSGLSHTLSLPASPESLQWAKENLGITDFAGAEIISAHYEFPYLSVLVPSNLIIGRESRPSTPGLRPGSQSRRFSQKFWRKIRMKNITCLRQPAWVSCVVPKDEANLCRVDSSRQQWPRRDWRRLPRTSGRSGHIISISGMKGSTWAVYPGRLWPPAICRCRHLSRRAPLSHSPPISGTKCAICTT